MRVSSESKSGAIAGAIAGSLRDGDSATLETIGVVPAYIAVKAVVIASKFLYPDGIIPVMYLSAEQKQIGELERTAFIFTVKGERHGKETK